FDTPEVRGYAVRMALIEGQVVHRPSWQRRVAFKDPVAGAAEALRPIRHAVTLHPPHGPLETVAVSLSGKAGETGRQGSLLPEVRRHDQLSDALRQLEVRLGTEIPIYQYREQEPWSRIPERRLALVALSL